MDDQKASEEEIAADRGSSNCVNQKCIDEHMGAHPGACRKAGQKASRGSGRGISGCSKKTPATLTVYALLNKRGIPFYVGLTRDIARREESHRYKYGKATKLIPLQEFRSKEKATDGEVEWMRKFLLDGVRLKNALGIQTASTETFGEFKKRRQKSKIARVALRKRKNREYHIIRDDVFVLKRIHCHATEVEEMPRREKATLLDKCASEDEARQRIEEIVAAKEGYRDELIDHVSNDEERSKTCEIAMLALRKCALWEGSEIARSALLNIEKIVHAGWRNWDGDEDARIDKDLD
jgi:hypothetical protein